MIDALPDIALARSTLRTTSQSRFLLMRIPHPSRRCWPTLVVRSATHRRDWLVKASVLAAVAALTGVAIDRASASEPDPAQVSFFEKEVRPVLAENCFKCHGEAKQKGGLRLDSLAAMVQGGDSGPAVVPGELEESLLVEAVNYEGLEMPPGGKLGDAQRAVLTRWVEMGAPWPSVDREASAAAPTKSAEKSGIDDEDRAFWSFQPVKRPAVPEVEDGGWSKGPIDRFLFARLAAEGLTPAPEADRRTLIRRASFDLIGVPPTPEEVEAFVADDAPLAYERLIDRLLADPRHGERWARHWLDLVRYAESDGYRQDAYRPDAWRYRDYVIRAFNEDKPYDRFVAEQLAGDEIAPGRPPNPDPPRLVRPDRPAADPRRGRRLRGRPRARRVCKGRRPPARQPTLRRALGTALARRRPLRRHRRRRL